MKADVRTVEIVRVASGDIFVRFENGLTHVTTTLEHALAIVYEAAAKRARKSDKITVSVINWYGFGDNFTPPNK